MGAAMVGGRWMESDAVCDSERDGQCVDSVTASGCLVSVFVQRKNHHHHEHTLLPLLPRRRRQQQQQQQQQQQ